MNAANAANIGGPAPPVRGRYSSGRVAEGRRMGASTLVGSDLLDLKKKMEHQQKVLASRPKPEQEMDDITKEIQERERLLKYEREREAALRKRLELDNQLKELQLQNDKSLHPTGTRSLSTTAAPPDDLLQLPKHHLRTGLGDRV